MGVLDTAAAVARSTLAAAVGLSGGPFSGAGPVRRGELVLDEDARLPGGARLLQPGRRAAAVVRLTSAAVDGASLRTLCLTLPDVYGPGHGQDFLLASSADGAPLHHVTLPAPEPGSRLYSSLWLYLAGTRPVLFGARATGDGTDEFVFMISDVIGRFRPIGRLTLGSDPVEEPGIVFSARHSGGGLRPLPPVLFYAAGSAGR